MASEANMSCSLSIRKGNLNYANQSSFQADVSLAKGPSPGLVVVTTSGVQISLALLANPGLAWVSNISDSCRVQIGIKDTSSGFFEPVFEWLPGESYPVRMARNVGTELTAGVGTGTAGSGGVLWAKAIGGTANIRFECFDMF